MSDHSHIIQECAKAPRVVIDPVKGRDGHWGVTLVAGDKYFFVPRKEGWDEFVRELLLIKSELGVWDIRRIIDWPLDDWRVVFDLKSLQGGDTTLSSLARSYTKATANPVYQRFLDLDAKIVAHARAMKTTKIDMSVNNAIPVTLLTDWMRARAVMLSDHWGRCAEGMTPGDLADEYVSRWPFIKALREVELNGIHVDTALVTAELQKDGDPATMKALRSLQVLCKGGFVTTLMNPMGGKTGRVRHEGGFNALAIPHGPARDVLSSRHPGGLIYTFDFNAIDYRCIVNSVGGEVAKLYEGANDFHERTASFIFKTVLPETRKAIKFLSYIYIYGGSESTLVDKTGWTLEQVQKVLALLDKKIAPIKEFREALFMRAQSTMSIDVPGGRVVYVDDEDLNPGKAIGLYAQTYSTWVFEQAFTRVQRMLRGSQSKVIFEVHDELVIDVHPDDFGRMEDVRAAMEYNGHVVKMKKGPSYGQQSE